MTTFNELNTAQLAALTAEQVEAFIRTSCMDEGIPLGTIDFPRLEVENQVDLVETEYFTVKNGGVDVGILFETKEDAEAFRRLRFRVTDSKYLAGYHVTKTFAREPNELTIGTHQLVSEEDMLRNMAALEAAALVTRANKELKEEMEAHASKIRKVSTELWEKVRSARAHVAHLDAVRACWVEYQELAKDMTSAIACMRKAYEGKDELLTEALGAEWSVEAVQGEFPF